MRNILLFVLLTCYTTFAWQKTYDSETICGTSEIDDSTVISFLVRYGETSPLDDSLDAYYYTTNGEFLRQIANAFPWKNECYMARNTFSDGSMLLAGASYDLVESFYMAYIGCFRKSGCFKWQHILTFTGVNYNWSRVLHSQVLRDTLATGILLNTYAVYGEFAYAKYDSLGFEIFHTPIDFGLGLIYGVSRVEFVLNDDGSAACLFGLYTELDSINVFILFDNEGAILCSLYYTDLSTPYVPVFVRHIIKDNTCGYYLIGKEYSVYDGIYQAAIVRIDSTGTVLRHSVLRIDRRLLYTTPIPYLTASNKLILFCNFTGSSHIPTMYTCDTLGNILAQRDLELSVDSLRAFYVYGVYPCSNGDFLLHGEYRIDTLGATAYRSFLVRIDSLGNDVPGATDIHDNVSLPKELSLFTYPNPFNNTLAINTLPNAKVAIFDLRGNVVFSEQTPNGKVNWCPADELTSGVYLVKVSLNQSVMSKRIVMIK